MFSRLVIPLEDTQRHEKHIKLSLLPGAEVSSSQASKDRGLCCEVRTWFEQDGSLESNIGSYWPANEPMKQKWADSVGCVYVYSMYASYNMLQKNMMSRTVQQNFVDLQFGIRKGPPKCEWFQLWSLSMHKWQPLIFYTMFYKSLSMHQNWRGFVVNIPLFVLWGISLYKQELHKLTNKIK